MWGARGGWTGGEEMARIGGDGQNGQNREIGVGGGGWPEWGDGERIWPT